MQTATAKSGRCCGLEKLFLSTVQASVKVDSNYAQGLVPDAHKHVGEQEAMPPIPDLDNELAHSLAGLRRSMHYWEQRQALSGASGNTSSPWRFQGTQPGESASPNSTTLSMGEKSERRKRKLEADETSGKPYACRFCSQSFDKSQALGGHMNRHRQEREREQLDNAQKLVLKQQSLQGFSGLPLQNLNPRAKLQGPTSFLSIDQVTLSRYNSAQAPVNVQYQSPRSCLPASYATLHSSGALLNTGTWNLGGYVGGGCTGSIPSGSSFGQLETSSGDSNLARAIQAATPEDIFAASVLQSAVTPSSFLQGRTMASNDSPENDAEQEMMYGYPGVSHLTQTEASCTSPPDKFNFNSARHSFDSVIQGGHGNVQPMYPGVQPADHAASQLPLHPPDQLAGQTTDHDTVAENEAEQDIKYGYSGVSTLTQAELEASTSVSMSQY